MIFIALGTVENGMVLYKSARICEIQWLRSDPNLQAVYIMMYQDYSGRGKF